MTHYIKGNMIRFFPKDFKIEHFCHEQDSSLLYTVSRKRSGFYDINGEHIEHKEIPVTLTHDNYIRCGSKMEDKDEVIKEESGIIDLQNIKKINPWWDRDNIFECFPGIIDDFINDMVRWYEQRMDFFGVRDKVSVAKTLEVQNFYPFISKKDILKIDVVVRFYEKKEEEFIKKEERNVLSNTASLGSINNYRCLLLGYEFEKAWPDKIFPSQYIVFCITYSLRLSKDNKRSSFRDIC